jgi:hypothetical protein
MSYFPFLWTFCHLCQTAVDEYRMNSKLQYKIIIVRGESIDISYYSSKLMFTLFL